MTFTFKLEQADGTPADPPSFRTAVPNWKTGDTIPLRPGRTLRVVGIVASADDDQSVLIVEEMAERASGDGGVTFRRFRPGSGLGEAPWRSTAARAPRGRGPLRTALGEALSAECRGRRSAGAREAITLARPRKEKRRHTGARVRLWTRSTGIPPVDAPLLFAHESSS
jgi:hypothetical protein